MNGAISDATWNIFFKMHFDRIYTAMLATSLGPLDVFHDAPLNTFVLALADLRVPVHNSIAHSHVSIPGHRVVLTQIIRRNRGFHGVRGALGLLASK